jgi:glutathione S-transferase
VASPCINIEHAGCKLDAAAYPKTVAYLAKLHARPSFAPVIAAEKALLAGLGA